MGRRRFRRSRGGGGGGSSITSGWMGFMAIVFGTIGMLIALIMYGIGLDNLDTAYTSAATYTEQVGLTSVMGIWPLVLFVMFMAIGLGGLGVGAYINIMKGLRGGWMDFFMVIVMGTVTVIIATLMNTTIQGQLHTVYTDAANVSKTANIASFSGLLNIMTVFGMVIFLSLMTSGIAPMITAAYGRFRALTGKGI